ncbi:MAG TPA: glycosyltransferase [Gaiellaceae bacterium]
MNPEAKLRILICTEDPPALRDHNGVALTIDALNRGLRSRHEVRLLAFAPANAAADCSLDCSDRLLPRPRDHPVLDAVRLARAIVRNRPLRADALAGAFLTTLQNELRLFAPDVVHVTPGTLAALGLHLKPTPAVLAALDARYLNVAANAAEETGLKRLMLRDEIRRVRRFEATEYRHFDRVVVVSEEDARALSALDPDMAIDVIPNGVDTSFYLPAPEPSTARGSIVFHGNMRHPPNVAAARTLVEEILPVVRRAVDDAQVTICGRSPSAAVLGLRKFDGVTVASNVADIRPWLWQAQVYVCPMVSGTGIKTKLLEAMSCGLPCVATPLAIQGLRVRDGHEVAVASTATELAQRIVMILTDGNAAARFGAAARAYVCLHHQWAAVCARYEEVYRDVIGAR